MKKIEEELEDCFELDIPEPDLSQLNQFNSLLAKNKPKRQRIVFFRKMAVSCAILLCVTLACLTPILWNLKNKETVRYYGDNDIVEVEVTEDFIKNYLNLNIPNYNFIYEDCTSVSNYAIYDKETSSKLLALNMVVTKNAIPFTQITINIILNKNYTYSKHSFHIDGASIEQKNNMKIYTIESNDSTYALFKLIERSKYNTYLQLNINDTEILEKFTN